MDILIGADPEFFVRSKKTGDLVSAHGLIAGTKKEPIPMGPGHAQVDGMALEINVPPARNAKEFIDGFEGVMNALSKELPDYDFDFSPVAQFGAELIRNQPREARELGCEPDFDAWNNGKPNPKPNAEVPFRTASGHIHIGWTQDQEITDPDHIEACNMLSRQMDFLVGLPSLLWDNDTLRRQLYGKAGCYRPKPYGMEYRTLSNTWLKERENIEFVVDASISSFNYLVGQNNYGSARNLSTTINKGDWKYGYELYRRQFNLPPHLNQIYKNLLKIDNQRALEEAEKKLQQNAAKGDVDGKGFPANHLAKIAWGRRRVVGAVVGAEENHLDLDLFPGVWEKVDEWIEHGRIIVEDEADF